MNERIYDLYLDLLTNYYSQLAKECNSNVHFVAWKCFCGIVIF